MEAADRAKIRELARWVEDANRALSTTGRVYIDRRTGEVRVEIPVYDQPGWYLAVVLIEQEGALAVAEAKVFPGSTDRRRGPLGERSRRDPVPTGGVTPQLLRRLSLADAKERGRLAIKDFSRQTSEGDDLAELLRRLDVPPHRTGRRGTPDTYYLPYAEAYAGLHGTRAPVKSLAAATRLKREVVRDLIYQCRRRGLLTPDSRLTDKARALAGEQSKAPKAKKTAQAPRGARKKAK